MAKIEESKPYKWTPSIRTEANLKPLPEVEIEDNIKLSFIEKAIIYVKIIPALIGLVFKFYKLFKNLKGKQMDDIKTTILGIIAGLITILGAIGINITPEFQEIIITVASLLLGIVFAIWGYLSKDKDKAK